MITTRKIVAASLLSLSFVAAAATVHSLAPTAQNESKVFITAEQQPSGETMTVVTVVAKRLSAKDKIAATFKDARDAMVTHG